MSKEIKLMPELRFPEFVNVGNWELKKVEEFFDVGSSKRVLQKDWTNEGVPFYRTRELVSLSKNEPFGSEIYISENLYEELKAQYGVPSEGDFLVSGVGTLGISYQVKVGDKFYFKDGNVIWFKLEGDLISSYFKYCFESEHIQKQIEGQTSKSTVGTYTITNAKKTEFWYTKNPQEQKKIASCLSSVDELLAAHKDKLDALKDHKKGLMQNLFPQEGETVPKVRFSEFEGDGAWIEKRLGKIGEPLMCKRIFKDQTTPNPENGIPFYKIGTFGKEPDAYIPVELYEEFKSKYSFPNKGDILISASGTIGRLVIYDDAPAYFQDSNIVWLGHDGKQVTNDFLYHCYSTVNWQTSDGGVIKRLYNSDLKAIPIKFPENEIEQQIIASCLSAVDELITAQADKIEQLQQHKKGLMQGLFPKIIN